MHIRFIPPVFSPELSEDSCERHCSLKSDFVPVLLALAALAPLQWVCGAEMRCTTTNCTTLYIVTSLESVTISPKFQQIR